MTLHRTQMLYKKTKCKMIFATDDPNLLLNDRINKRSTIFRRAKVGINQQRIVNLYLTSTGENGEEKYEVILNTVFEATDVENMYF